jgi:hypothetical protein
VADTGFVGIRTAPRLWLLSLAAAGALLWLGSRNVFWGDYFVEAWPAYFYLRVDGVGKFLHLLPAYSGFATLLGAPVALLGRSMDTTFRLDALPGVLGLAALGVAFASRMRGHGHALLALALVAGSPVAYLALDAGHPEEVLAASASVGAVLVALRGRDTAAGVLLAIAILAKQTAVLAVLPAALALPRPTRRVIAIPVLAAVLVYGPLYFVSRHSVNGTGIGTAGSFHPCQIWWPFGVPATTAWAAAGHGGRISPAWLMPIPHPLIVALALPLSGLWWWRRGEGRPREDAFALLALLSLERCLLDPWNLGYYHLPLVLALLAWESERRRPPVIALASTAAVWLTFHTLELRNGSMPLLTYLAWTLPIAAALARALYARPAPATLTRPCVGPSSAVRPSSPSTSTT